jgi:alkaline phosphatase D
MKTTFILFQFLLIEIFLSYFIIHFHFVFGLLEYTNERLLKKIAFGSCNRHDAEQPAWKNIVSQKPDLFIWLGDAI